MNSENRRIVKGKQRSGENINCLTVVRVCEKHFLQVVCRGMVACEQLQAADDSSANAVF